MVSSTQIEGGSEISQVMADHAVKGEALGASGKPFKQTLAVNINRFIYTNIVSFRKWVIAKLPAMMSISLWTNSHHLSGMRLEP